MTQKKNINFFFCVFFILAPFNSFAQSNTNLSLFKNIEICNNTRISKFAPIHNVVTSAYSNWNWHLTEKVRTKASILIEYDDHLFLYGLKNLKNELSITDLNKIGNVKYICIYTNSKIPFLYIQKSDPVRNNKENGFYYFLHPGVSDEYDELTIFKEFFGTILYTNLEVMTEISYTTLEIKLTHEAIHLFGQSELQNYSPEFNAVNVTNGLANHHLENIDDVITQELCQDLTRSIQELSSRQYLQYKEKCSPIFRELVQKEICLGNNLIEIINKNGLPNKEARREVLLVLNQIKEKFKSRTELFNDQDLQIEWYWYLLEGVPQYLEQKVSLSKDKDRISNHYKSYCAQTDEHDGIFYPLLTGAAIWHGFEYLSDVRSEWDELAMPTEYNARKTEDSNAWFEHFQSILDRFSEKFVN